jgi:putative transport protein
MPGLSALTTALGPSATALLSLSLAIALGLMLGRIKVRGVRLGVAGVLFSSLALAQVGVSFQSEALPFVRDFALVLFVYALGLQIGPGFVTSLRAEGLRLNLLAVAALGFAGVLAAVLALAIHGSRDAAVGTYAGALNSTPALAGGQVVIRQMLASRPEGDAASMAATGLAYAVTYPFGVVGPILAIVLLRRVFKIRMADERTALAASHGGGRRSTLTSDIEILPGPLSGRSIRDLSTSVLKDVVLSRLHRDGKVSVPRAGTVLRAGDVVRAIGETEDVQRAVASLGKPSTIDLGHIAGEVRRADLVVTRAAVLRRPLKALDFLSRDGVLIAMINRAGVEFVPHGTFTLKFGDQVTVVGPEGGIKEAARELGNAPDQLNLPHLVPLFIGIVLGMLLGAAPLALPGLPAPLRIGLAGGPFLVALLLSQLGSFGPMVWYMPTAANRMVQDLGLSIFLACIGFQTGPGLLERALHAGPALILCGAAVTFVPIFIVGCFARRFLRMNFVTLSGWVAGTMTSAPALVYATEDAASDGPALAFASVAPLGQVLPIVGAEVLALFLR